MDLIVPLPPLLRVHLLGHGDAGRRGEESDAGRRPAAQEVPRPPALHPGLLQERGRSGEVTRFRNCSRCFENDQFDVSGRRDGGGA